MFGLRDYFICKGKSAHHTVMDTFLSLAYYSINVSSYGTLKVIVAATPSANAPSPVVMRTEIRVHGFS